MLIGDHLSASDRNETGSETPTRPHAAHVGAASIGEYVLYGLLQGGQQASAAQQRLEDGRPR